MQPAAQRNPKLKETNKQQTNSPPHLVGGGVKGCSCITALLIHVLLQTEPDSHFSDPRNACREMWKQLQTGGTCGSSCRQEEHAKKPRSAQHLNHTKIILGNTSVDGALSFISFRRKHWLDLGANSSSEQHISAVHICQSQLSALLCKEQLLTGGIQHLPNPVVSGSSFLCRSLTLPRAAEISSPGINELFPQMFPG